MTEHYWRPGKTAPHTGETIEIMCTYGVMPWYGIFKWDGRSFQDACHPPSFLSPDFTGFWRPYEGSADAYREPTNGAQDTEEYWRQGL